MKNRIQKITLAFLIMMSSFFGMISIKAAPVGNVTTSRTGFNYEWIAPGGINGMTGGFAQLDKIYADGVLATCFDPGTTVNGGPGYNSDPMPDNNTFERLKRLAIANDINNMNNEQYAAWQLYQHTIMFADKGFQVTSTDVPNLQAHYNQFEVNATNYWKKPTFNFGDGTIKTGETKVFNVTNGVMNGWKVDFTSNNVTASFSNGKLTVTNNNATDSEIELDLVKEIGAYQGVPMVYNKVGSQQLGIFKKRDPDFLTINLTNLRYVDVTVSKVDKETGATPQADARLNGAEYSLFKKDGTLVETKVIPTSLQIKFEKLMASDEYYIQETKAPLGYLLNTEKIVIKPGELLTNGSVGADLQYSVTSREQVIKGKVSLLKISSDGSNGLVNPLAGAEFTFKLLSDVDAVGWDNAKAYDAFYEDVEVCEFASDKQQFKIDYVGRIYENDSFIYNYEITNDRLPSELIYTSDEPLDWVDDNTYLKGEIEEYYIQDKYDSSMFASNDTYAKYQYYNIWQLVIKSDDKYTPFQKWKDENLEKVYEKYVDD